MFFSQQMENLTKIYLPKDLVSKSRKTPDVYYWLTGTFNLNKNVKELFVSQVSKVNQKDCIGSLHFTTSLKVESKKKLKDTNKLLFNIIIENDTFKINSKSQQIDESHFIIIFYEKINNYLPPESTLKQSEALIGEKIKKQLTR